MPTTARTIYRDSLNFYKNERRSIVTLSAILAVVLAIVHVLVGPNPQEYQLMIEFVANFKNTQLSSAELEAMSNSVVGIAKKVLSLYAFETLQQSILVLILLMFAMTISAGHNVTLGQTFNACLPRLPKMFLLIVLCSILISAGFMVMIIPGIILLIGFALAPVVLVRQQNMGSAIRLGWKVGFSESGLLIPALGIWILLQFGIGFVSNLTIQLPDLIHNFLFYFLKNMASAWMIIYLFRLFMLVENKYTTQQTR
ncbi:YciC family protein [Proteus terrae]|uniref:YciC family protein n=1 Tax=Proteus terrae TaxID=1574161 RepID=UPI00301B982E